MKILIFAAISLFVPAHAESVDKTVKSPSIEKAVEFLNADRPIMAARILAEYRPAAHELYSYHFTYANALEQSKRFYASIAHFRLAYLNSEPGEAKEHTLLKRAETYQKMRYYSEAALNFRVFLNNYPDSRFAQRAHLGFAESLRRLGIFSEAVGHYEKSVATSLALYGRANALQSLGKTEDAHDLYMSVIARDRGYLNSSPETVYNIGENFRRMGKFSDAKIYLYSIKDPSLKYRTDLSLGLIALEKARFDSAIKSFESALQSRDRRVRCRALFHLADAYMRVGRQEEAKSRLLEIRNKYPYGKEYDAVILMLSRLYKSEGKIDEAISLLKELIFRRSPNSNALDEFEAIILDAEENNSEEFLKLWEAVGHWLMEPSRSHFLLKIAKSLRPAGKPFLDVYTWLFKYGSTDEKVQSRLALANFFADMGDAVSAKKYLQGVKIKDYHDDVFRSKAKIYRLNAEYQKALDAILSIREIRQDDIILLSETMNSVNNIKKAVDFYEKALKKVGGPAEAYIKLADLFYGMGRKSRAIKYYKIAVSMRPDNRNNYGVMGDDVEWAYYRISMLSGGEDSTDALSKIQNGSNILSRFAEAGLKELKIAERINRGLLWK